MSNTISLIKKDNLAYWNVDAFSWAGGVRQCLSTRLGGVSEGEALSSLNLGFGRGDTEDNVRENYEILCGAIGANPRDAVLSKQVHRDTIIKVTGQMRGNGLDRPNAFLEADGLMTNEKNILLVVFFADCVPLLFYDPTKRAICAIHSGWRGAALQIARSGIEQMVRTYGCDPSDILACIGPSIGPCCYVVGEEVADAFGRVFANTETFLKETNKGEYVLNLWRANEMILLRAGLLPNNITQAKECTKCNETLYYSHRRMGDSRGSLAAMIELI